MIGTSTLHNERKKIVYKGIELLSFKIYIFDTLLFPKAHFTNK